VGESSLPGLSHRSFRNVILILCVVCVLSIVYTCPKRYSNSLLVLTNIEFHLIFSFSFLKNLISIAWILLVCLFVIVHVSLLCVKLYFMGIYLALFLDRSIPWCPF
jgi:hypothetical protein